MDSSKFQSENPLAISWHDANWIPILNPLNVMDYFAEKSNPFYDRTCNNEIIRMQRANPEQMQNMQGTEFFLLHVQEPILYVIRKQSRHSPTHVTPIADYYIIAGIVYQAPDLGSVFNSRLLTSINHLQSAFDEAKGFVKYHPSKGYWWDFGKKAGEADSEKPVPGPSSSRPLSRSEDCRAAKAAARAAKKARGDEPSSLFQRQRVDVLLDMLTRQFPPRLAPPPPHNGAAAIAPPDADVVKTEPLPAASVKSEVKAEPGALAAAGGVKREAASAGPVAGSKKIKSS